MPVIHTVYLLSALLDFNIDPPYSTIYHFILYRLFSPVGLWRVVYSYKYLSMPNILVLPDEHLRVVYKYLSNLYKLGFTDGHLRVVYNYLSIAIQTSLIGWTVESSLQVSVYPTQTSLI